MGSTGIIPPHLFLKIALKGCVKQVAANLGGLHKNTVYKMWADPRDCRYTRFFELWLAVNSVSSETADFLTEDFLCRVAMARSKSDGVLDASLLIEKFELAHAKTIRTLLLESDAESVEIAIKKELSILRTLLTFYGSS